jgi:hypothetical protein
MAAANEKSLRLICEPVALPFHAQDGPARTQIQRKAHGCPARSFKRELRERSQQRFFMLSFTIAAMGDETEPASQENVAATPHNILKEEMLWGMLKKCSYENTCTIRKVK